MHFLVSGTAQKKQFGDILEKLGSGKEIRISGIWGSFFSCLAAALNQKTMKTVFVVVPDEEADEVHEDLAALGVPEVLLFPQRETPVDEKFQIFTEITGQRVNVLMKLINSEAPYPSVVIASPRSLAEELPGAEILKKSTRKVMSGELLERDEFIKYLAGSGYTRSPQVMFPGEFSVRGGIIDVFASSSQKPARIELLGNEVVSLREFDAQAQTSTGKITEIVIPPASELQGSGESQTLLEYAPEKSIVLIKEPFYVEEAKTKECLEKHNVIYCSQSSSGSPETIDFLAQPVPSSYQQENAYKENRISSLIAAVKNLRRTGYGILMLAEYSGQAERMAELLKEYDIIAKLSPHPSPLPQGERENREKNNNIQGGSVAIEVLDLSRGWTDPSSQTGIIVLKEIFGIGKVRKRRKTALPCAAEKGWRGPQPHGEPLSPGNYVVHMNYGIGLFMGTKTITVEGSMQDLFMVEYAQGNNLYVPLEQMSMLQKYIGRLDPPPPLNSLGSTRWQSVRKKIKKSVEEYAKELLELYAWRRSLKGYPFAPDTRWQQEFEMDFPYEETADQVRAIEEVKADMEKDVPMDRVICGDVGYGKTEVAMRAAFKSVMDGRQAAVLVPTTILAEQHFQTFSERMAPYPVRIEMLSRFRNEEEQKKIIKELGEGRIDVVIGTHRMLQNDIKFTNLGLLIVDEEQRFGVIQKEYLKKAKKNVDILTLSATPIPRTLYMSVHGVRDMSIINTPPLERISIKTTVAEFSHQVVRNAVLREMERKGQVFYVHNRIRTIEAHHENLQDLVPDARIAVAHGQMDEEKLERIMTKFLNKEYDVLLSTDIVGAGLDIANANTIIITESQDFGLAQLYQLRGRVGRTGHQAFAYLFYNPVKVITETARRRLNAISEFTQLGSGLHLAMKDLEIRGAGNLLGKEQHGHIQRIGLELYCKMLEDAVSELKGEPVAEEIEPALSLNTDAFIPDDYIGDIEQKTTLYRKMANARGNEEIEKIRIEMKDRYGQLPVPAEKLLKVIRIRAAARQKGIDSVTLRENEVTLSAGGKILRFGIQAGGSALDQIYARLLSLNIEREAVN